MEERKTIYLCLAHMSETGEEQKYVKEAFDTNWVVPLGPNVNGFEDDLKAFVSKNSDGSELSREVVALSAGTAAVHLGLLASGVGPGDEVCVQSFTFCASSHPITYLGATPVSSILNLIHGIWIRSCWRRRLSIVRRRRVSILRRLFLLLSMVCLIIAIRLWRFQKSMVSL